MNGSARTWPSLAIFAAVCLNGDSIAGQPARADDDIEARIERAFQAAIPGGRYMERGCSREMPAVPGIDALLAPYRQRQSEIPDGARRFPIEHCRYTNDSDRSSVTADVIMMNPDAAQLARWAMVACRDSQQRQARAMPIPQCAVLVARMFWNQANAQFPISGMVAEPGVPCDGFRHPLFGFRHGVTVAIQGVQAGPGQSIRDDCRDGPRRTTVCTPRAAATIEESRALLTAPVIRTAPDGYARLSNLSRGQAGSPVPGQCPRNGQQPEWLDRARDGYLEALGNERYPMLTRWLDSGGLDDPTFNCPIAEPLLTKCPRRAGTD